MERLTKQEENAMWIIWDLKKGFIKDFLERYPNPKPPYTTLASVIKNLERKKYVKAIKYGNTYEYTPLIEESDYKRHYISNFVKNHFKNSYRELVSFFIKSKKLSAEELKQLINIIEKDKSEL